MSPAPPFPPSVLELVRVEARRIARLMPDGAVDIDDLVGYGHVGLVEARDRFDPRRGVNFELYARHRIRGAIFDGVRQALGPLRMRPYRRLQNQIITWQLAGEPQPAPRTEAERAAAAEVTWRDLTDLVTALLVDRAARPPPAPDPEAELCRAESLERLRGALKGLEPARREAVDAHFDLNRRGDSAAALARRLGVNRSTVTRRMKAGLRDLKRAMRAERPP